MRIPLLPMPPRGSLILGPWSRWTPYLVAWGTAIGIAGAVASWARTEPASEGQVLASLKEVDVDLGSIRDESFGELLQSLATTGFDDGMRSLMAFNLPLLAPLDHPILGGADSRIKDELEEHLSRLGSADATQSDRRNTAERLNAMVAVAPSYLPLLHASGVAELLADNPAAAARVMSGALQQVEIGRVARRYRDTPEGDAVRAVLNYVAGRSELEAGQGREAIGHLKQAIGYTRGVECVAQRGDSRTARDVEINCGEAGASELIASADAPFTTGEVYRVLVVAYVVTPAYVATSDQRDQEFRRAPLDRLAGDITQEILSQLVPWSGEAWGGVNSAGTFGVPEHLCWALSNLHRRRIASGAGLSPLDTAVEAMVLARVAREAAANKLIQEDWQAKITARSHALLAQAFAGVKNPDLVTSERLMIAAALAGYVPPTPPPPTLLALAVSIPQTRRRGFELVAPTLERLDRLNAKQTELLAGSETILEPPAERDSGFDAYWRQQLRNRILGLYAAALHSEAKERQVPSSDHDAEASVHALMWIGEQLGSRRYSLVSALPHERQPSSLMWIRAYLADHPGRTRVSIVVLGVLVFGLMYFLALTFWRYRVIMSPEPFNLRRAPRQPLRD